MTRYQARSSCSRSSKNARAYRGKGPVIFWPFSQLQAPELKTEVLPNTVWKLLKNVSGVTLPSNARVFWRFICFAHEINYSIESRPNIRLNVYIPPNETPASCSPDNRREFSSLDYSSFVRLYFANRRSEKDGPAVIGYEEAFQPRSRFSSYSSKNERSPARFFQAGSPARAQAVHPRRSL